MEHGFPYWGFLDKRKIGAEPFGKGEPIMSVDMLRMHRRLSNGNLIPNVKENEWSVDVQKDIWADAGGRLHDAPCGSMWTSVGQNIDPHGNAFF